MESIIEAEIDFGFQLRAERFILALKLLRADARSAASGPGMTAAWLSYVRQQNRSNEFLVVDLNNTTR